MSEHTATLLIDGDRAYVKIACNAGPLGQCRAKPVCDCEEFTLQQAADGTWFHTVEVERRCEDETCKGECDTDGPDEVVHEMPPGATECHFLDYISCVGAFPNEYYEGARDVPLHNTPIVWQWHDEAYWWRREGDPDYRTVEANRLRDVRARRNSPAVSR
jgi:hypothetical protein